MKGGDFHVSQYIGNCEQKKEPIWRKGFRQATLGTKRGTGDGPSSLQA
jgi:hypothetical protein